MKVHQGDQADQDPSSEKERRSRRGPVDRRFAAIIGVLRIQDPRFARRVSEARRLRSGQIMTLVGFLATLVLGVVPLALGIQTQLTVLLTLGAVGIAFAPVVVPPLVGLVLHRVRPAW